MAETVFPVSLNWYYSKIISTREDGSIAYGGQNQIFVLEVSNNKTRPLIIPDAHEEKVTSVTFCPVSSTGERMNLVLSSSDDGFVKLWDIHSLNKVIGHNSHCDDDKNIVKVVCASWNPTFTNYIVSAAENDTLVLWDINKNITSRFNFPNIRPAVVECSYYHAKIVAVGSKNGMVYVMKLGREGEILHKFHGHDKEVQSLAWNPIPFTGEKGENCLGSYLASSCPDKEIFIWNSQNGECLAKILLPKRPLMKEKQTLPYKVDLSTFVTIFWGSPNRLYSSTKYGELICCDPLRLIDLGIGKNNKNEDSDNWSLVHGYHSHPIIAVTGIPMRFKVEKDANRVDNETKKGVSDLETSSCQKKLKKSPSLEIGDCAPNETKRKCNYLASSGLIWTVGKDQKLIGIREDMPSEVLYYFHTINGYAFALDVSPLDPNLIAIGAGDGKIRLWNGYKSSGSAYVFSQKLNDRVYSVGWHPYKSIVLAFGTSEGNVGILEIDSQKPLLNFTSKHKGKVYRLSWGPQFSKKESDSSTNNKKLFLYSCGGNKILVHNPMDLNSETFDIQPNTISKKFVDLCWKSDFTLLALGTRKGFIYILKPPSLDVVCNISATTKCVMALSWHPMNTTLKSESTEFQNYLTFASIDNENVIKVYNYTESNEIDQLEQVSILRGHSNYVQFVTWSPHKSGQIMSCSADYTVRIWDVATSAQLVKFAISQSILPLFCVWSPLDADVVVAGFTKKVIVSFQISKLSSEDPVLRTFILEKGCKIELGSLLNAEEFHKESTSFEEAPVVQNKPLDSHKSRRTESRRVKETEMFSKAWSTNTDALENCYNLLKKHGVDNGYAKSPPNFKLSFLRPKDDFEEFLASQDETYRVSNEVILQFQLEVLRGNLKDTIQEHIESGDLNDYIVSLAPFASNELWQLACESYANILIERKQIRKAATYLLAINKVRETLSLLEDENLFLEALCVARSRLPESDAAFSEIVRKYGEWLTKNGNTLKASECFVYLKEYAEAAKVLAMKNQPEHLSLAALASRRADEPELETEYSYRALVLALETEKLALALRICTDHPNLKILRILYEMHQLLYDLDKENNTMEHDLITLIKKRPSVQDDPAGIYESLPSQYNGFNRQPSRKTFYVLLAHKLSLASCAPDKNILLSHILQAMNAASKYVPKYKYDVPMTYKLTAWMCPEGVKTEAEASKCSFGCRVENIKPKIISLRAFMCLGIVELMHNVVHQNYSPVGDMSRYPALLDKLINDALDKQAFLYYKYQDDIKRLEKKIKAAKKKKNRKKRRKNQHQEVSTEHLAGAMDSLDIGTENNTPISTVSTAAQEQVSRLKAKMKEFEDVRVIAPNPATIYSKLKEIFETTKENIILKKLEKKWQTLILEDE